jgi:hypothetical protein
VLTVPVYPSLRVSVVRRLIQGLDNVGHGETLECAKRV